MVIVGSAKAHGRLELRTDQKDAIQEVDAAVERSSQEGELCRINVGC